MGRRLQLQTELEELLGSRNVYFQPPPNIRMNYPAIVYEMDNRWDTHASNRPYVHKKRYQVTSIDNTPDSLTPDKIAELPLSSFSRNFVTENLHHVVFNLYY